MRHSKTTPIIAIIVALVVLLGILLFSRLTMKTNTSAQNTNVVGNEKIGTVVATDTVKAQAVNVCKDPGITTMIGSVYFPIADKYVHLPGLGQFITAEECSNARLKEVTEKVTYGLVGGEITLKQPTSPQLWAVLNNAGFSCATKESIKTCLVWKIKKEPALSDLLKLKPFVEEFASEKCGLCG